MNYANMWVATITEDALNREIAFLESLAEALKKGWTVKAYLELEEYISGKKKVAESLKG